jgi:hypothetical protein
VVRLVKAGVKPEIVKAFVQNSSIAYQPSAAEIIDLRDQGVPSDVLTAVLERGAQLRAQQMPGANMAPPPGAMPMTTPYPTSPEYGAYAPESYPGYDQSQSYPYSSYPYSYYYPDYYTPYSYASYPYYYWWGYPWWGWYWPYYYGYAFYHHHDDHHDGHHGSDHGGHPTPHGSFGHPATAGYHGNYYHGSPGMAGFHGSFAGQPMRYAGAAGFAHSGMGGGFHGAGVGGFHGAAAGGFHGGGGGGGGHR